MMEKAPSRYHTRGFIGKSHTADGTGYVWGWDSAHPELVPTATFKVGSKVYCSYCCGEAYPIQEGLRRSNRVSSYDDRYKVTGHCCICDAAESEKAYREEVEALGKKHRQEEKELARDYRYRLLFNTTKRLELEHAYRLKELEWSIKTGRVEGGYIK